MLISLCLYLETQKFIPKHSHFDTNSIYREIYVRFQTSYKGEEDIHTKLMRKYKDIPSWWVYLLLIVTIAVSLVLCTVLNDQVQLPWWGLLFASAIAYSFILPISIITATTNQVIGLTSAHFTLMRQKFDVIKKKKLNLFHLSLITISYLN